MQPCYRQTVFKSEYFKVNSVFIFLKASIFFRFCTFLPFIHFVSTLLRKDKNEITLCRGLQQCGTSSRETFHLVRAFKD